MEQVAQLADLVAKALEAIQLMLTQHQDRINFWAGWEVLLSLWVAGLTWKVRSLLLKKE